MKQTNKKSLKKTIGFATTFALLGASLGVDVGQVWAAQTTSDPAMQPGGPPVRPGFSSKQQKAGVGANQLKIDRGAGANQLKIDRGIGANQVKLEKGTKGTKSKSKGSMGDGSANRAAPANPDSTKMLNPQPFPPKTGNTGNAGLSLPAVQK